MPGRDLGLLVVDGGCHVPGEDLDEIRIGFLIGNGPGDGVRVFLPALFPLRMGEDEQVSPHDAPDDPLSGFLVLPDERTGEARLGVQYWQLARQRPMYLRVFTKSEYVDAMLLSLYYMAGAVVQLALALFFASVLSLEKIRGSGIFKGILFFPFLVNGIAIGYIFKYFYTRGFVLDSVLQAIGIPLESLPYWLRDQSINNWSLVFTSVWKYCGQNMVLFIGAIASIDPTLYEAATIDGANRWQQFKAIILPGIKTVFMLNLILSITGSLSAFEPAYVVGSMGANGTATFFIKIHQMAHVSQKVGQACAMAMVLMALILLFTALQRLFFRYVMKDSENTFNAKANKAKALW